MDVPVAVGTVHARRAHGQVPPRQGRSAVAADGKSWISMEDYAIAMLDEIEQPKHVRERFTVGY
jgi:hypothetical protein